MAQVCDGHIGKQIVKEPMGFAQKIPTGPLSGYFDKVPTMYPVGKM